MSWQVAATAASLAYSAHKGATPFSVGTTFLKKLLAPSSMGSCDGVENGKACCFDAKEGRQLGMTTCGTNTSWNTGSSGASFSRPLWTWTGTGSVASSISIPNTRQTAATQHQLVSQPCLSITPFDRPEVYKNGFVKGTGYINDRFYSYPMKQLSCGDWVRDFSQPSSVNIFDSQPNYNKPSFSMTPSTELYRFEIGVVNTLSITPSQPLLMTPSAFQRPF
jgi:hypothetical protein